MEIEKQYIYQCLLFEHVRTETIYATPNIPRLSTLNNTNKTIPTKIKYQKCSPSSCCENTWRICFVSELLLKFSQV